MDFTSPERVELAVAKSGQKFASRLEMLHTRHGRGWALLMTAATVVVASFWIEDVAGYFAIRFAYGPEAWDAGLRFVSNKPPLLSNGEKPSAGVHFAKSALTLFLMAPILYGSATLFSYIRMRAKGENFRHPEANGGDGA